MNLGNQKENTPAAGASKGGKPRWRSVLSWVALVIAGVAIGAVIYLVASPGAQAEEEPVVTESRDSFEPPDTAVQSEEERQIELQDPEVEEVVTTPTTSPPTTIPEPKEPEDGQEAGAEEESEVPTSPASQNVFGNGEDLLLVEAYSLGCPACADYHPILKQIREEYKDQITFQVVHFPLAVMFGNSRAAHQAVEAAAKQGKFWQMHDILFERRDLWTALHTEQPFPQFEIFAEEIGLDLEQFRQDFHSTEVGDVIDEDERYLRSLDVSATPTFFLNGQQIASSKLAGVELTRQTLNEALGIEPEEGTVEDPEGGSEDGEPEGGTTEDPEEGTEDGEPEGEPQEPEEGEEVDIPDPVRPNQTWLNYQAEIDTFLEDCGYWDSDRGGYRQCDSPEGTQTFIQMKSDFLGCQYDHESSRCEGYSYWEYQELKDNLACGQGLHLSPKYSSEGEYQGFWCFHPDHPHYDS
ncbi:thioredoxin domain-containing protein [Candidatus Saccharibacteria bacterium]|nr:thioredoxin domain-containing protein [Candidatus Saccharibacteria bacterium]